MRVEKRSLRYVNHIIVVSKGVSNILTRLAGKDLPHTIIGNGVDPDKLSPTVPPSKIREQLKIPANAPVLFFHGSFRPFHGVENLIRVFSLVKKRIPDAFLLLVGDGPTFKSCRKLAGDLELLSNIRFTGFISNESIANWINIADICLYFPAIEVIKKEMQDKRGYAGKPTKFIEYMIMRKPIITLECEDMIENVKEAGAGIFVKKPSYEEFASEIIKLLGEPERRRIMGENARRYALANCTLERAVAKRVEIINSLLSRRPV